MKNNRLKTMNCITVLDFEVGKVFQYNIGKDHLCWNPDYERCEQFSKQRANEYMDKFATAQAKIEVAQDYVNEVQVIVNGHRYKII